ncbi:MAG: hypothetical protein QOJ11_3093 [Frankiales bacterium]|jgi:hypothetical protein|nr:hypothetical protein [Frankiales bacterium]
MSAPDHAGQIAWLPSTDAPWDDDDVAVQGWLADRNREGHRGSTVVANTSQSDVEHLIGRASGTVNRINQSGRGAGTKTGGPVVVGWPTAPTFVMAWRHDRQAPFCAVEAALMPLSRWAQQVGAYDLNAGAVTPDTRSPELVKDLDHLEGYGNNGFGDQFGKKMALSYLRRLAERGELDRDVVLGYMLASYRVSDRGIKHLGLLIDKVSGPRDF